PRQPEKEPPGELCAIVQSESSLPSTNASRRPLTLRPAAGSLARTPPRLVHVPHGPSGEACALVQSALSVPRAKACKAPLELLTTVMRPVMLPPVPIHRGGPLEPPLNVALHMVDAPATLVSCKVTWPGCERSFCVAVAMTGLVSPDANGGI